MERAGTGGCDGLGGPPARLWHTRTARWRRPPPPAPLTSAGARSSPPAPVRDRAAAGARSAAGGWSTVPPWSLPRPPAVTSTLRRYHSLSLDSIETCHISAQYDYHV